MRHTHQIKLKQEFQRAVNGRKRHAGARLAGTRENLLNGQVGLLWLQGLENDMTLGGRAIAIVTEKVGGTLLVHDSCDPLSTRLCRSQVETGSTWEAFAIVSHC